ncbi:hypothetical protein B0T16DRAFT_317809 [Cercophora newfieldiana]|uniref:DUF7924 domain-containing protein n=1 Tax=Cercophora newfieldiana TaxID=92897 RepID=A0AA39YMF2_9PEZI|nr:hypothetical protein B0T16DRAFT_317809 [Cercophora newfieldiana]
MAVLQNRKRQLADQLSQHSPPTKRVKSTSQHHDSWQYPPEFWDGLSKIWLTRAALEELDRRTARRPSFPPPGPSGQDTRELGRFARHGGPDLSDLRGYPDPKITMSSSRSSRSRPVVSTNPTSVTSGTTKSKRSTRSAYDPGFEQHLTDHAIHPTYISQEPDLEEARAAMAVPRPSLSPSQFSDGAFTAFRVANAMAKDEEDVTQEVIPVICGTKQADHPVARNTLFVNLEPLTDGTIAPAKPDLYYGAAPVQLQPPIRDELRGHIVPSSMEEKPMAPNFFLEVKGPAGSAAVATLQARYDGAIGARGIHSLQNYGEEEPAYDGRAYTFSSTYHDGQLKTYAHHVTAPTTTTPGGRPEYHMTQLRTFGMTDTRETFVQGATAFRNLRDLARRHRDDFIQAANARLPNATMASTEEDALTGTTEAPLQDSSPDLFVDCEEYAPSDVGVLDADDGTAASFDVDHSRKRSRQSRNSPSGSQEDHAAKKQARKPAPAAPEAGTESVWVETYRRKGMVCFKGPKKEIKTEWDDWVEHTLDEGTRCFYWLDPKSGQAFWTVSLPRS